MNIPKVLQTTFFIEQLQWLLLNYILVSEIAFDLISLFRVQTQEPKSRSTTTRAFVFLAKFAKFYYHKIFEKRIQRIQCSLWPLCNWSYKDLSMSLDQKVLMEKCPINFCHRDAFAAQI